MPLTDRPVVRRLVEQAEERLGVTLAPTREVRRLQMVESEFGEFRQDAEELAFHSLDYFSGRPQELRPERRRRLAQRSRVALLEDPLAGAEAQLLSDFAFGKGVPKPTARDPEVQKIIDEAWTDPINEQIACGYAAQRKLSNELIASGELFPTVVVKAGRVRLGRLDCDLVQDVVPDPEMRLIPLWYVVRKRTYEWNFATDAPAFADQTADANRLRVEYWPHWRNVADAIKDRESEDTSEEAALEQPPPEKLGKGLVYPLLINQLGESLRGNPPWARSLRFMSAMNVLTEAHVTMAQAASTFIARRGVRGSPRQITKAASSIISAASELGASAMRPAAGWGTGGNAEPPTQPFTAPGTPGPFPPGSWWQEHMDNSKLEALSLNSGAAQMAQTAQIVRAPIAATSGFGQHYLGDASDANLATASTLELPATMHVGGWQEHFEGFYRWFTDRAIEAAVQAGRLGGAEGFPDRTPLSAMHLDEAGDRAEMEQRTEKDLSYEFSMPFPGRRQLADVVQLVQLVSQSQDPNGVNVPLRQLLLRFLFEQMGIDDVSRAVQDCIPDKGMPGGIGPQADSSFGGQGTGNGFKPGATGAAAGAGAADPGEGQQPYGAKSGTAAGGGSAGEDGALESLAEDALSWLTAEERKALDDLDGATARLFREIVMTPENLAALAAAGVNGSGD